MKGLIVAAENKRCVVLKEDGTFLEMRNRNFTVGQKIELRSQPSLLKMCAAAALIMVCFSATGITTLYHTPFSYVYLDINPSMRIELNCFSDILSVVPLNDDAKALMKESAISSDNIETCIEDIVDLCQSQAYLHEENKDIEISVMTRQHEIESSVQTASEHLEQKDYLVSVYTVDRAENQLAVRQNVSGKVLRAIKEYTEYFGGTLSENMTLLSGKTAEEIRESIRAARRATQGKDLNASTVKPLTGKKETLDDALPEEQSASTSLRDQRRQAAIQQYTEYFGGSIEDNTEKVSDLSISEIYAEIRTHRQSRIPGKSPSAKPTPTGTDAPTAE